MAYEVRLVTDEAERDQLYRFRYDIYVEEVRFTRKADHARRWLKDDLDDVACSFAIFEGERVVGSLRTLYLEDVADVSPLASKFSMAPALEAFGKAAICTTSRFMVEPSLRNGSVVFKLMRAAYVHAIQRGVRLNYGDCSPHLIPFYEHMGYRRYTSGFNDSAYGYKIPILMLARDHVHFAQVRSLLARLAQAQADDAEAREWFARCYGDYVDTRSAVFLEDQVFLDLLSERVGADLAHHLALLHDLDQDETKLLLNEATLFPVKRGDRVVRKGDSDASVFVLLKGLAKVVREPDDAVPVAMLGAGDTFGEIGFLTASARTAHVIAETDGEVLVLTAEFMDRFRRQHPAVAAKVFLNLARELAARLALTTAQVSG
jgi:CRP-like cAMP-binding protein